jgi:hypothetical protein
MIGKIKGVFGENQRLGKFQGVICKAIYSFLRSLGDKGPEGELM